MIETRRVEAREFFHGTRNFRQSVRACVQITAVEALNCQLGRTPGGNVSSTRATVVAFKLCSDGVFLAPTAVFAAARGLSVVVLIVR